MSKEHNHIDEQLRDRFKESELAPLPDAKDRLFQSLNAQKDGIAMTGVASAQKENSTTKSKLTFGRPLLIGSLVVNVILAILLFTKNSSEPLGTDPLKPTKTELGKKSDDQPAPEVTPTIEVSKDSSSHQEATNTNHKKESERETIASDPKPQATNSISNQDTEVEKLTPAQQPTTEEKSQTSSTPPEEQIVEETKAIPLSTKPKDTSPADHSVDLFYKKLEQKADTSSKLFKKRD